MLSAVVTAKAQENCGFPGVAPGRVCPVTANPGKSTQVDTSLCSLYDQPEQITITDPAHPLFRQEFVLVEVRGSVMNGYAVVVHHGDISLRVPVRATSLCPASPCPSTSKLSLQAIRDLLRLTIHGE